MESLNFWDIWKLFRFFGKKKIGICSPGTEIHVTDTVFYHLNNEIYENENTWILMPAYDEQ